MKRILLLIGGIVALSGIDAQDTLVSSTVNWSQGTEPEFIIGREFELSSTLPTQNPAPMIWGEIPESQWKLETYEQDPDAQAILLCDYGEKDLSKALGKHALFYRHRRIKILGEGGIDWADQTIPFYSEVEKIKDFQAHTLNYVNGKVEKHVLDESDFLIEELEDGWKQLKFFMPQVKVGSIMEIKYTLIEESLYRSRPWYFQSPIPTLHSELCFSHIPEGAYTYWSIISGSLHQQVEFVDQRRWVLKDSPAWEKLPFVMNPEGHITRIRFQLKNAFTLNRTRFQFFPVFERWEQLHEKLAEYLTFKKSARAKKIFKSIIQKKKPSNNSVESDIAYYYEAIRDHFVWDGDRSIFPEKNSISDIYEASMGNSAEINLVLCELLKEAKYSAYPLLLSTRSHGRAAPSYPWISQFNHLIVVVETSSGKFFLDATDKNRPYSLLDPEDLDDMGWVFNEMTAYRWIRIPPPPTSGIQRNIQVNIGKEGILEIHVEEVHTGYAAVKTRTHIKKSADDFWKAYVEDHLIDGELEQSQVFQLEDSSQPLKLSYAVTTTDYVRSVGEISYLQPMLWWEPDKNPFLEKSRNVPAEFSYPYLHQFQFMFQLPKGYRVEELPPPSSIIHPFKFEYAQPHDEQITLHIQHGIPALTVSTSNYPKLQEGYEKIIRHFESPLVLSAP